MSSDTAGGDVVFRFEASLQRLSHEVASLYSDAKKCSVRSVLTKDKERDRLDALSRVEGAIQEQIGHLHEHVTNFGSGGIPPLEFSYPNPSNAVNCVFDPLRGVTPVSPDEAVWTSTALSISSSRRKYSLILLTLQKIMRLLRTNSFATRRDLYYESINDYPSQSDVDSAVTTICAMLRLPRLRLHVMATSRGLVAGNIVLKSVGDGNECIIDCQNSKGGEVVPQNLCEDALKIESDARFVLVVEKDATFQRLLDDGVCAAIGPCVLITGKGVPDLNTRQLVRRLWDELSVPVFVFVDADPWGYEIMLTYRFGSVAMAWCCESVAVPAIRWIGVLPSDFNLLVEEEDQFAPLTEEDRRKINSLQNRESVLRSPNLLRELELMKAADKKAEIQG